MDEGILDKLDRLNILLKGDEALQHLNTHLNTEQTNSHNKNESEKMETDEWTEWMQGNGNTGPTEQKLQTPSRVSSQDIFPPTVNLSSSYCPVIALTRLPHKYFKEEALNAPIAKFFEPKSIFDRAWTLYYLPLPPGCHKRLLLLIPLKEAYDFIHEVNTALACNLIVTEDMCDGFVVQFDDPDDPQPMFLGESKSIATKDKLVLDKSFTITGSWGDWSRSYEPDVLKALEDKIGAGLDAERYFKAKGKGKKGKKKRLNALELARAWAERMDRLQQYFGLRPKGAGISTIIPPVIVEEAAPWPYPDPPIFFSVDVEWKEKNANQVTEIGISILDTQDLVDPPGLHGANWVKKIRSHHLRVSEHRLHVNRQYCRGCPDDFNFGTSEFVGSADIGARVDQFFSPPYDGSQSDSSPESKIRPLIYVGHNTKTDLEQLALAGSKKFRKILFNGSEAIFEEVIDTALLYQGSRNDANSTSLSGMMTGLNIWTRNLHNGGNDARYAMVALVSIALEAAGEHEAAVAEE